MSTNNPLNEFNSYSYHHFIVIADTSARADTIADNPEDFFQLINSKEDVPGLVVLVNPMTSNKLIVQDISWQTIMNADSGTSMYSTSINAHVDGKMTLLEPLGVRFFNKIYDAYRKLNLTNGGLTAVWVIKTVFVGYRNAPGDGQPEYISNLKPMQVFPLDFTAEFTEAGGKYDISFVAANGGAGGTRLSNSTALTAGGTINLGGKEGTTQTVTLQTAMQNLELRIAENYEKNYTKIAEAQAKSKDPTTAAAIPSKMQFQIRLHEMLLDSSFVVEVPNQQSVGGNGKVPTIATRQNERLEQTIERVLKLCPQVMKLATEGDAGGVKWLPNIIPTSESIDPTENAGIMSRSVFNVTMRQMITQYNPETGPEEVKDVKTAQGTTQEPVDSSDANNTSAAATTVKLNAVSASNYLEYDYTYTGRNVDVLTYDMRMNMATGLFQTLISPQATVNTGQVPAIQVANVTSPTPTLGAEGNKAPVVNPKVANSPQAVNSSNPVGVSMYEDIFKKWVQTETIAVNMKIRGNPLLTDGLTLTKADVERSLQTQPENAGLAGNWLNGPVIVKVNVRMPVEDDPNQYEKFWYDGFYRVIQVNTTYANGDFTQELEMLAMTDGSYPASDNSTNPRPMGPNKPSESAASYTLAAEPTGDRLPIQSLSISDNGLQLIKHFESFSATKYVDVGRFAIGYGHNLTDAENASGIIVLDSGNVVVANGITEAQASELLRRDVKKIAENPIHNKVSVNMYQNEYDVLCSMTYNLGSGVILGTDSTLLKVLNRQQYSAVPAEIVKWNKSRVNGVLQPNSGLITRRAEESAYWGTAT